MYHSIKIGDKDLYEEYRLVSNGRPAINPPEPNYTFVEVGGSSKTLDLSEVVSGEITYKMREGDWSFLVLHDYPEYDWQQVYKNICNYMHGKRMQVRLEDDPSWYYDGRITVKSWATGKSRSTIGINYKLDPFKYREWAMEDEDYEWLWDDLNLDDGYIPSTFGTITLTSENTSTTVETPISGVPFHLKIDHELPVWVQVRCYDDSGNQIYNSTTKSLSAKSTMHPAIKVVPCARAVIVVTANFSGSSKTSTNVRIIGRERSL